jgi:hypothetical protein
MEIRVRQCGMDCVSHPSVLPSSYYCIATVAVGNFLLLLLSGDMYV